MLRALRSGGIVQVLMVGVVGAIIAVFVLEFRAAGGSQVGPLSRRCVVSVAGKCSSVKDFFASYNLIVPRGMQAKHVKALDLRRHIAEGLLERELLVREAERLGISTTVDALDDDLAQGLAHVSLPADQALRLGYTLDLTGGDLDGLSREMIRQLPVNNSKTGKFDPDIYKRTVRNVVRRSPKEFKELQKRELIAARMRDIVRSRVRVSEDEAFQAFARDRSQAVVRTVSADRQWFARYAVDLSDTAVDAYIAKHEADIDAEWKEAMKHWAEGCPLVSEILVPVPPDGDETDKAQARDKAAQAAARIEGGEPFGDVAREVSEGASAVVGGYLGCLEAERYGEGGVALVEAARGLEAGEVSDVIESERGFHVLGYHGKLSGEAVEKTGRRAIARTKLALEKGSKLAEDFAKELLEKAKDGESLEEATQTLVDKYATVSITLGGESKKNKAKDEDDPREPAYQADRRRPRVEISSPFTANQSPIDGALPQTNPARAAFSLDKDGDVHPELIPTLTGFAVMQLKDKTPATRAEFDDNKAEIMRQLLITKRADALAAYVERLKKKYADETETEFALIAEGDDEDAES